MSCIGYVRGARPIYNTWWNIADTDNPPAMIPNPDMRIGRIPPNIECKEGNMQLIELDGRAVLEMRSRSLFHLVLDEPLTDDFSLEFTAHSPGNVVIFAYFEPVVGQRRRGEDLEKHFLELARTTQISYRYNAGSDVSSTHGIAVHEEFKTVEFQIDDGYALMYIDGERVAQIPNFVLPEDSNINEFYTFFFDFNSSALRPESTPELERIYRMLMDYGRPVVIEGHTDAIGSDDYNMELSQDRAESVKQYLVDKGIDGDLIEALGKGESDPVSDNETDEGRQANRRVVVAPGG